MLSLKKYFFIFSRNLPETFLNIRRIQRDIILNVQYIGLHVKCHYTCQILVKIAFSRHT